ncbi:type II secretion system F family protein [Radiobacillus sp. PE A8.2]|uniref:type II secretion system F family protein n=1 Tax=Radiobacillus sp. PE A8.2 TaxID=3380349 RepID=UPI00388F71C0
MSYYSYQGRDRVGKLKKGKISADTRQEAMGQLKGQGIAVFKIKELNSVLYMDISFGSKVKNRDFVLFLRQFSTLIEAGIPLIETTTILQEQIDNPELTKILEDVKEDLEAGVSLSQAFNKYPKVFPSLFINMIIAGEASGTLDEVLNNLANYYENQFRLKQKVVSALTYPLIIAFITILVTMFLLAYIVPTFANMFASMGEELPAYTAFVLKISGFLQDFWWTIPILIGLIIVGYGYLMKQDQFAYRVDVIKLRIPIFGKLMQKAVMARLTRTLSSLINSSVPIIDSVQIAQKIVGNRVVEAVLKESAETLEQGESMAGPMDKHWVFPVLVTQMIAVGEQSGSLDEMLKKVADFYDDEVEEVADRLKSYIEPVMIVLLTGVIGSIVLAIVIPMFAIYDAF